MAYKAKTKVTEVAPADYVAGLEPERRRADAKAVLDLMAKVSGEPARMWGPSIIGYGTYQYRYASGHSGEMCRMGFSPRSNAIVLYLGSFDERQGLLDKLGKYTTGKSCIYIKRLSDVDEGALRDLVHGAWTRGTMMGQEPSA